MDSLHWLPTALTDWLPTLGLALVMLGNVLVFRKPKAVLAAARTA